MTTNEVTAVKISTPCTRKCKLIGNHCIGCGRTWQQIRDWTSLEESERLSIINSLKLNIEKIQMSYSQLGQDLEVIKTYNNKENGFFIEIGASDGIYFSNTYLLETKYKWRGICCEPIPHNFKKLVKNRPNSICYDKAVYNKSWLTLNFDIINYWDVLSGISDHIDPAKSYTDNDKNTIQVQTISLLDVLNNANAPSFIEYMSLDTEGSEFEILKNFDFEKYTFGLIDVEHNHIESRRVEIKNLLLSKGYIYKGENQWDDMYKHNSI